MTWRVQAKREHNNGCDRFFAQIRVMYVLSAALASEEFNGHVPVVLSWL